MRLKRREFLQRASLALGALRINEAGWWRLQSHYSEALAQTTGGKLAFFVGHAVDNFDIQTKKK